MASSGVYGSVGLSQLKRIAMSAFDKWIQQKHPEIQMEFNKLPKTKKTQTFYNWMKKNYPNLILQEWPIVAKIRSRRLMREVEHE